MAHGHASVTAKPWTPWLLSPKLWLDASDASTITESSGAVSEWRDKSGNGYAFTQSTSTAQPTTGSATQNSRNVLSFDGGDSLVSTAAASAWKWMHDGTNYLVGVVAKRTTAGTNSWVFGTFGNVSGVGQPGAAFRWFNSDTVNYGIHNGSAFIVTGNASVGTSTATRLFTMWEKPTDATAANRTSLWIDGAAVTNPNTSLGSPSASNPTFTFVIGTRADGSQWHNGTIAEVIFVLGAAVTTTNRTLLHDYLNKKWAIY